MSDSTSQYMNIINNAPNYGLQGVFHDQVINYEYIPPRPSDAARLAAAEELLQLLPVSEEEPIPAINPLPLGSHIKGLRPNPLFVGRDDELRALAALLKPSGGAPIIAITTGIGGIGKTQLAIEFAHRYGQFFAGGVFWVSFSDSASVEVDIAACGSGPLIDWRPDYGGLQQDEQIRLVLSAWQSSLPRLLIFDNCEEETLLAQWRPPTGGCRVLVTSRRSQWDATLDVTAVTLPILPRQQSIALLQRLCPSLDGADAIAIASELGDLPLALHLAGTFLRRYQRVITPTEYLQQLCSPALLQHRSMQQGGLSPTAHEQHVARTFAVSYERLNPSDPADTLAIQLLARAAAMAPGELLPRELLCATLELRRDDAEITFMTEDALQHLIDLGLLTEDADDAVRLHRLIARFARDTVEDPDAQSAVERVFAHLSQIGNQMGDPRTLQPLQVHLHYVTDASLERADALTAVLCNEYGQYLSSIGDYKPARTYIEHSVKIAEVVHGADTTQTAACCNQLGLLLLDLGDYQAAQPLFERARNIVEQHCAPDDPWITACIANIGRVLALQGRYNEARPLLEQAFLLYSETLGLSHPKTMPIISSLAALYEAQGDYDTAATLYRKSLELNEELYGSDHPETAASMNNLASLLQSQGEFGAARILYEHSLQITEDSLGPMHPDTARRLSNIGTLLQDQGNYAEAQKFYERALSIREQSLGSIHPDTAQSMLNLGSLHRDRGQYALAHQFIEQAQTAYEQVLGPEHPATAASLQNLAFLLSIEGRYAEAQRIYEHALVIHEHVFGSTHPDTLATLSALGYVMQQQQQRSAARAIYERLLPLAEQALGPDHPRIATELNNLGSILQAEGAYQEARSLYERALAIRVRLLDANHPETAISLTNLGSLLLDLGDVNGAQQHFERALAMRKVTLGAMHHDTAITLWWLGRVAEEHGQLQRAMGLLRQAHGTLTQVLGGEHPTTQLVYRDMMRLRRH